MDKQELYSTIFKRKSIRKYELTPLDAELLEDICTYVNNLRPLYNTIKTEMKLVAQKDVNNLLPIKAPHYIVAFSENKEGYLTNIGFMLQQLDLYLAVKGLGSCWQGIPRPTSQVLASSDLEFVIVMSFGRPKEPLYRNSVSEFKRNPIEKICSLTGAKDLIEPVRLAPSATNSQPWYFTGSEYMLHAYCVKTNFLKALIYKKMNQVDMGIALYHLWLAAQVSGRKIEFRQNDDARQNPPQGYYYILSAVINSNGN